MGGFECADHINRSGERINLQTETQHDIRVFEDYSLLNDIGIKVVREGICWSRAETSPYQFDFSYLDVFYEAAEHFNFQIIWDLCHFGYPDGLIPTHPKFTERFKALCIAFALYHNKKSSQPLLVVPINEISFLSWHSGDMRGTVPFAIHCGFDIKYHLCKAAIEGIKALKEVAEDCVVFGVEPLVKVHAADEFITEEELLVQNSHQFQAMDMMLGRMCPELGGEESLLDVLGFNYYYNNQWNHHNEIIPWPETHLKLAPLSEILEMAYSRYHKPMVITETGHFGTNRKLWLEEITLACKVAAINGVDLRGICIYPVIDRPDWDDLTSYSNCGFWDLDASKNRIPYYPYLVNFEKSKRLFYASVEA